jgi:uncharacterized protein (TIGR03435 family)
MSFVRVVRIVWIALAVSGVANSMLVGQAPTSPAQTLPSFEVASIRPSKSGGGYSHSSVDTDGGVINLRFINTTLLYCVQLAFNVRKYQVVGPSWISSDRYDILAKGPNAPNVDGTWRLMLQSLLANRFALKYHHETEKLPIYVLTVAKGGPKLRPPQTSNSPLGTMRKRGVESFTSPNITMRQFAAQITKEVGRPVVDGTDLSGHFTVELFFAPFNVATSIPDRPGRTADLSAAGPSIFTALQEQLGLKLKPEKGPVEVVAIDHISQPSQN